MAKQLKDILKQAHDTIKGVRPSTTDAGSTGKDPGVDYKPKAGDEDEFVAKHSVQKWDDPNGNEVDHYSKGIKYSLDTPQNARMGYKQGEAEKAEFKAVKEAKEKEDAQCNNSPKGTACPVHGLGECSSMKPIKEKAEQVDEVLTKSTTAGETIHDFVHSDNPKFKGKSKEKRKQMALAAYYAKQNEDTYPVQPLLGSADIAKNKTDDTQDEIDMVRTELKAIANKVMHMLASMPADHHIEPWVQAKIASAKEMIGAVHDYMMYSDAPKDQEKETMDTPMTFPNMSVDVNSGQNV